MRSEIKCCKECSMNIDLMSKYLNTYEWCKHLNIPLLNSEGTVCDGFKLKKRTLNSWNFRKIDIKKDSGMD